MNDGFVAIPRWVVYDLALSMGARVAWGILFDAFGHEAMPDNAHISSKWLAGKMNRRPSTVEGYMDELAELFGLLARRDGRSCPVRDCCVSGVSYLYRPLGMQRETIVNETTIPDQVPEDWT